MTSSYQLSLLFTACHSFPQDGVDFLVAETADGRMDLSDAFYFDAGIEMYARPKVEGIIPTGPRHLQV